MFEKPSLVLRIAIGKGIGLIIGLIGLVSLPYFAPDVGWSLRLGVLFWYATVGAIIGVFGVFTYHPVLRLPMPWWFRSTVVGAWMNFVLILFSYDTFAALMPDFSRAFTGDAGLMTSPYWFVVEGAVIGLIIGYLATRFGGEGPKTAGR